MPIPAPRRGRVVAVELELQIASEAQTLPHPAQFKEWVGTTLANRFHDAELTIRIVDEDEMAQLNETFRNKKGTTNVLSFTGNINPEFGMNSLGDIVICAPVVQREATEQDKELLAHWAHMVVHGTLHLLGYDHIDPEEAKVMETLESEIILELGYKTPYGEVKFHE